MSCELTKNHCCLEQSPEEIIKCIFQKVSYECPMCNSMIKSRTHFDKRATSDSAHCKKLRNKNISKVCEYLRLEDELRKRGLLPVPRSRL